MTRRDGISFRPLFIAALLALILSLLPARYLSWTQDAAAIIQLPVVPFGHAFVKVRTWLRPGQAALPEQSPALQQLQQELEQFKTLYQATELENQRLREEIEQLTLARREGSQAAARLQYASIVGENAQSSGRTFFLNRGSRAGVQPDTVAVHNGVHLIGKVGPGVSALTSELIPLTDPAIRHVEVYLRPDATSPPNNDTPRALLKPAPDGTLVGEVALESGVAVGHVARLDDPSWPPTATALIVGFVEKLEPKPENPLRLIVSVRPRFTAEHLASVTLKVQTTGETP